MIGVRISCILILIKIAVALNADGLCSFIENYTERVTYLETFKTTVPFSKKCGVFYTRTCFEYRDRINYERVAKDVQKTRNAKRCCQGYIRENSKCVPVCTVPCLNGSCTEPETCTCFSGFHKNDKEICVKNECDPAIPDSKDCSDGVCAPNGVCKCNEGYVKNVSKSSVESKCIPKCSEGCLNGNCVSPEKCVCDSGYEAFNSSVCSPICLSGCLFGTCTEPNKCSCFEGYQLQNGSDNVCDPVCSSVCLNGNCVKPNVCLCDMGFELDEESKECEPICDEECVNSNCTSPNVCTCKEGFSPLNSTHCEVLCENCTHGFCDEPNVCQCDTDYHMNYEENICVQNECTGNIMEDSCENGYCSGSVCMCNSGYEKNATNMCSPICSLECVNSYCSEPEVCQCHTGFELSTLNSTVDGNCTNCTNSLDQWNICVAICLDCQNGTCIEGNCDCVEGYVQHPQSRGKCIRAEELDRITQANNFVLLTIIMGILGVVLISVIVGLAYWRYVIWSRQSYPCGSVAGVVYRKDKCSVLLE